MYYSLIGSMQKGAAVDADATAFITAAGITNTTQKNAINTLVLDLKNYGIWAKSKAIYPFVGGSATTHQYNLKDPRNLNAAFRLGFYGGVTHNSNGVSFDGGSGGAFTYFNPFTNQAKNNLHMSIYPRIRTANRIVNTNDIGPNRSYVVAGWTTLRATSTNTSTLEFMGTSDTAEGVAALTSTAVGFSLGSRTSSTAIKYYKNTTSASGNGASHTADFVNAELCLNGSGWNYYSIANYAFASLGDGLTDTEAANFYTAVQAFQTTLGRQVGVPIVSDTNAQAFLNAANITDITQANAVNTLVTSLKSYGLWDKMKAIYPMVGGIATTHKFNLKDPRDDNTAFRLSFGGTWTHSSNGALPDGANTYADTFLNALTTLTNNNYHLAHYSRTQKTTGGEVDLGAGEFGTAKMIAIDQYYAGAGKAFVAGDYNTSLITNLADTNTLGLLIGSRTTQTSAKLFMNNVQRGSTLTLSNPNALPNNTFYLGSNHTSGPNEYSSKQCAFASIGDGLTDTDVSNLYTTVQAYQTTLGRQV